MQKLFGLNGIIFAQPIADLVAVLIAAGMFIFLLPSLHSTSTLNNQK